MIRNVVLLISCLALMVLLFLGYQQLVEIPTPSSRPPGSTHDLRTREPEVQQSLRIGEADAFVNVTPGQEIAFTRYDPRSGRATEQIRCQTWRPVAGSADRVTVEQPVLHKRLPSGMDVTIAAQRGEIQVDSVRKAQMNPQRGWLEGDVRIEVDRSTEPERTPLDQRPQDRILIATQRLDFDLLRGGVSTTQALRVEADEVELSAAGLELLWNAAENRVESLRIPAGGQLVYHPGGRFARPLEGPAAQTEDSTPAESLPASQPADRRARPEPPSRERRAYECILSRGVRVDQMRGDARVGGLVADTLTLTLDVGARMAGDLFGLGEGPRSPDAQKPSTSEAPRSSPSAATSRPALPSRVVVEWSGALSLAPARPRLAHQPPRRDVRAEGQVRVDSGDRAITCRRLYYEDQTQRLWLQSDGTARVRATVGERLALEAGSVYVDRGRDLIRLIGAVSLRSQEGTSAGGQGLSIDCSLWAELHLAAPGDQAVSQPAAPAPPDDGVAGELFDVAALESAEFNGDVGIRMGDQVLLAEALTAQFRSTESGESLADALTSAVARGQVRFEAQPRSPLDWAGAAGRLLDRLRGLRGAGPQRWLACDRMEMRFARSEGGRVYPREITATGVVRLADQRSGAGVRGRRLVAELDQAGRPLRGTVYGARDRDALVFVEPFAVRAAEVRIDDATQVLAVDGAARVSFLSERGLRGQPRGRPSLVRITCDESLRVDGQANRVVFRGNVHARASRDSLKADALTLLLADLDPPASRAASGLAAGLSAAMRSFPQPSAGGDAVAGGASAGLARAGQSATRPALERSTRKEPVLVRAERCVAVSRDGRRGQGAWQRQTITAPELEVELRSRQLRTAGQTTLLIENYNLGEGDSPRVQDALGLPSSLMTRGPSQTVMQAAQSMRYVMGEDGPSRRDWVVFEGKVRCRHVAGREIRSLSELLPESAARPELLAQLKDRNALLQCDRLESYFSATQQPDGSDGPLRLSWINATGRVQLRDQEDRIIRTVTAQQLEFDREQNVIHVFGSTNPPQFAQVIEEDLARQNFRRPLSSPEITINLTDRTMRTKAASGSIASP